MRQIVLDTETTGLDPELGHRIIEIGCVELLNRRLTGNNYHQYLQPDREIDEGALEVHGITQEFLADKPRFGDVVQALLEYLRDAELIIHNAPFDVGFLNAELRMLDTGLGCIEDYCGVVDTLKMARGMFPGQANSLDALCKRHGIDNSQRTLHGALLDAEILADVYLAMTGGQTALFDDGADLASGAQSLARPQLDLSQRPALRVISASEQELQAHRERLQAIDQESGGRCIWLKTPGTEPAHSSREVVQPESQ